MYCLCLFTKNKKNKPCFRHDMAYGGFKDLGRRRFADRFLRDKDFNFAKDPKYDG